jgi:DNA-binding transcriptional MocR family regulator
VAEARKGRGHRHGALPEHRRPEPFGFLTPPHLIEAVERAMRDGHNGYTPSPGILGAREAVAADFARGRPDRSRPRAHHLGHVGGHRARADALVDEGDEVLVPSPTYPLYTAVLAKIGAEPVYYRTDPDQRVAARSRRTCAPHHGEDARARRHRSEQPDRRDLPGRDAARADRLAERTAW